MVRPPVARSSLAHAHCPPEKPATGTWSRRRRGRRPVLAPGEDLAHLRCVPPSCRHPDEPLEEVGVMLSHAGDRPAGVTPVVQHIGVRRRSGWRLAVWWRRGLRGVRRRPYGLRDACIEGSAPRWVPQHSPSLIDFDHPLRLPAAVGMPLPRQARDTQPGSSNDRRRDELVALGRGRGLLSSGRSCLGQFSGTTIMPPVPIRGSIRTSRSPVHGYGPREAPVGPSRLNAAKRVLVLLMWCRSRDSNSDALASRGV